MAVSRNGPASEGTLADILAAFGGSIPLVGAAPNGPGPGSATPADSRIFNIAFAANTAANKDLGAAAYAGLQTAVAAGKLLVIKATAQCWYNWGTAAVTIAAASTAEATPATQGAPIFAGERVDEHGIVTATKLNILGGPVAGTLSIFIAEP